jgi:hypothetical protein
LSLGLAKNGFGVVSLGIRGLRSCQGREKTKQVRIDKFPCHFRPHFLIFDFRHSGQNKRTEDTGSKSRQKFSMCRLPSRKLAALCAVCGLGDFLVRLPSLLTTKWERTSALPDEATLGPQFLVSTVKFIICISQIVCLSRRLVPASEWSCRLCWKGHVLQSISHSFKIATVCSASIVQVGSRNTISTFKLAALYLRPGWGQ